jgi:hypothetical protein
VLDNGAARVILKMLRRRRYQYQFEAPGDYRGFTILAGFDCVARYSVGKTVA